ncbi:MAG: shikimate kinase [Syntrophales bacterium]
MNIVLIGYRGTGKSVVAEILAKALNMARIGMDSEIVKKAGLTIPEIVEKYGWERFRDIESQIATKVSQQDNVIIDTGGGVIERPENMVALRKNSIVIWLKASVDMIVKRIESGTERPSLTKGKSFIAEVSEVLGKRSPKYSDAALHEIDTDAMTPEQVADRIKAIWKRESDKQRPI